MRPPNQSIHIIGWGDVPTEERYAVTNDQVLGKICINLRQHCVKTWSDYEYCALHATFDNITAQEYPKKVEEELDKLTKRTGQEITDKIGVVSRQWIRDIPSTVLAADAAERAIAIAEQNDPDFNREKIKIIGSGGSTPDDLYPSCAAKLQCQLGIPEAEGCDYSLACCSGTAALLNVAQAMWIHKYPYGLVAVGETIGSRSNACLNEDATIWGDGGGAVVLKLIDEQAHGLIAQYSRLDGSKAYTTKSRGIGTSPEHRQYGYVDASMEGCGKEIFRWVRSLKEPLSQFLDRSHIDITDRTFFLPHNGNIKMVVPLGVEIGIPEERALHRIQDRANQSSASVLSTLAYYAEKKCFKSDDTLIFATFGGGLAYNFLVYIWP